MRVEVEETNHIILYECDETLLVRCLTDMKREREERIGKLQERIEQYEKRRAQEEAAYRKMPVFRRWISGRTPDHHLAVEYMVYVKRPMQEIEKMMAAIRRIDKIIEIINQNVECVTVPSMFAHEIIRGCVEEGRENE
jgi:hypothetical protein